MPVPVRRSPVPWPRRSTVELSSLLIVSCLFVVASIVVLMRAGALLSLQVVSFLPHALQSLLADDLTLLFGFLVSLLVVAVLVDLLTRARSREKNSSREIEALRDEVAKKAIEARKFQQAVENSAEASAITLPDLRYVYINPAWQHLTGYSSEEAMGQTPALIQSSSMKLHVSEEMLRASREGRSHRSEECIFRKKNGEEYFAEETMYPIISQGTPVFFVLIHHDITARIRSDRAKTEFISLASHQLRTPLTALRLTLNALVRGQLGSVSETAEQAAARAMEYAVRMAGTVNTMLSISQVEEGYLKPSQSPVPLASFLTSIREDFQLEIQRKKQICTIDSPADLVCMTDQALLREVTTNLLGNALRYTRERGTVAMTARREGGNLRLDIADSGCGIPSYQVDKIFTKFFRGDNVVKIDTEGTGLGLYLVGSIIRLLQGSITFKTREGQGTTFSILLPLTPARP